ncbi:MAG: NAD-dependent protein deacetylase 1 [Actinomycetota bacterium]|nr:NAD-dependent protein deacetylase 1 [Actinomycetota bacterium]
MTTALPPRTVLDETGYAALLAMVGRGSVAVLTGAGMSTASGIPDYRGPDGRRRVQPMQHGEFLASSGDRRRYWARAYVGWARFSAARPNSAHRSIARLQQAGLVEGLITQNVDGLHQAGGAAPVLELHGNLARVVCLTCGEGYAREQVHEWLRQANPGFTASSGDIRPDGDVVLAEAQVQRFRLARCLVCGSDVLKPDVVFFGGSVAKPLVERAFTIVQAARSLLVLGSSLQVMSGYRFVRRAGALGMPVAVVTRGATRGDAQATVRLDALLGDVLPRLVTDLT